MREPLPSAIAYKLGAVRPSGEGWSSRCPAHEDRNPSLTVTVNSDGRVLIHCHAGCAPDAVLSALGVTWEELRPAQPDGPSEEWTPFGPAIAVYHYVDENGGPLFDVCRTADKQFPQRRPDPAAKSGWRWSLGDTRRVPYRLPRVLRGVADGQWVFIAEGEKDVHAIEDHGGVGTCNPGGAGKWRPEFAEFLRDAYVTVIADADKPGQAHARQVAASLQGVAQVVQIVEAAEGCKDAAEHFGRGFGWDDFRVTHPADVPPKPDLAPDIHEILAMDIPPYDWIVEGFLERGERLILTGPEGFGKSYLVRQFAVSMAAGVHPFRGSFVDPVKVLLIDCENSLRQTRNKTGPMVALMERMGRRVPDGGLRVVLKPRGIDLAGADDAAWLLERVEVHKPDVVFIGPLYRLHAGKTEEEMVARKVTEALDAVRIAANCALVIEAHSPHGESGRPRTVRPLGSSLFLRWPEYGYGIRPYDKTDEDTRSPLEIQPWRGPRDEREWPTKIRHGGPGELPWVPLDPIAEAFLKTGGNVA